MWGLCHIRDGDISFGLVSQEMGISAWGLCHIRGGDISLGFVSHEGLEYQFWVCRTLVTEISVVDVCYPREGLRMPREICCP